ncbi:MAG: universal stress protein [Omnitrophica WOR_2 bacterium]|jgi:nucleotide-binding universal stress UspA family protein
MLFKIYGKDKAMETITEKIVTIARFPNNRALLLQSRLQGEGIDCFLSHQNLLQAAVSMGVEIKVREVDVERALRLIETYKKDYGSEKEKALRSLKNVRRILVPVDFSKASENALKLALEMADMLKAEIKLFHVYYNPVIDVAPFDTSHSYQINLSNYLHEIEQNARKQMNSVVSELRNKAKTTKNKVKISFSLSNGMPTDEILRMSHYYHPGLIVMGSRGMGNQSEGLIGNVTAKVVAKSEVPVIAIPENFKYVSIKKVKNILFATDFDNYDQIAISRLINLMHPFNATLHCVHISIGVKKSWDKIKMDSLKEFIEKEYGDVPVKFKIIVSDNIINGLECYMRDNKIDVISLTNHSRGLLNSFFTPSVTKMIMKRINRPLFAVKATLESELED